MRFRSIGKQLERAGLRFALATIAIAFACVPAMAQATQKSSSSASASSSHATSSSAKKKSHRRRPVRREVGQKSPTADRIQEIQSALAREGYYKGDPSGKWDSDTQDAMRHFQEEHDLTGTGKIDAQSLQKLGLGSDIAGVSAPRPQQAPSNQTKPAPAPVTSGTASSSTKPATATPSS
jgi:peptidoglycan hydrolase-like protein with peptidoglycan-binding domain